MIIPIFVSLGLIALIEATSYFVLLKKYNRTIPKVTLAIGKFGTTNGLNSNLITMVWGKKFTTDNFGSRPFQKANTKPKKVWIGDSVVEGLGVSDSMLFTKLLSSSDTAFEYLNFAHAGNTPLDYFNAISSLLGTNSILKKDTIHSFHIGICLNDIYSDAKIKSTLPTILHQANEFFQISNTYRLAKLLFNRNSDGYFQHDAALYKNEEKVHILIDQLVNISALCKSKNVPCQFYLFPYKSQFVSSNFAPQQTLAYHMGINGLSFVDLSSYLRKVDNPTALYLFSDEIHFSENGHEAIASILERNKPFLP